MIPHDPRHRSVRSAAAPAPPLAILAIVLVLLALAPATLAVASGPSYELRPMGPAEHAAWTAEQEAAAALRASGDSGDSGDSAAPLIDLEEPGALFFIPRFEVDTTSPLGASTLWAVRNTREIGTSIEVIYFAPSGGAPSIVETFTLAPKQTFTRSVRDVAGLPVEADGRSRGVIFIRADSATDALSVDSFRLIPEQEFATGSRAVNVSSDDAICDRWDIRFLAGGVFSGGTTLTLLVNNPQGIGPGADGPSAVIRIYDEPGNLVGTASLFTEDLQVVIPVSEFLDALPGSPPPFGAFEIDFATDADGGYVDAVYDANDEFSVGVEGTCLAEVPGPTPLSALEVPKR